MRILRLAWSNYQSRESLQREKGLIEQAGFDYRIAEEMGEFPESSDSFDVLIINSQFEVSDRFLSNWRQGGTIITASSGYDRIDLDACENRNVRVVRTPIARAKRVVQHTMTFIHSLLRDIPASHHHLRNGEWTRSEAFNRINRLSSLSVGILGYGIIGQRLRSRLADTPYEILAWDPDKQGTIDRDDGVELRELDNLLSSSNILTIHASLTPSSRGLITEEKLGLLREPTYLINTARGAIVDFGGVLNALRNDRLTGAALDVYPEEPVEGSSDWPDNLLTTPHTAGFGPGLLADLRDEIVKILKDIEADRTPQHCLTSQSQ